MATLLTNGKASGNWKRHPPAKPKEAFVENSIDAIVPQPYVHRMNMQVAANSDPTFSSPPDTREHAITLDLLDAIDRDPTISQRRLASELGIALGLANAYLKRCAKKGFIKISSVPARRFAYYLTPHGFAEKARLTQSYLSNSFGFFRTAREDCLHLIIDCIDLGWSRAALLGVSDLAEIMALCCADHPIELVGIVDVEQTTTRVAGIPIFTTHLQLPPFDGVIVTDMSAPQAAYDHAGELFGYAQVKAPRLLRIMPHGTRPS